MLPEITIGQEYVVFDHGTSDGTQVKYFKDGFWYKTDRYGGEGEAEMLAAEIMQCSGYPADRFVPYRQIRINGEAGCVSPSFLNPGEQFVTIYRLFVNTKGKDPAQITAMMDYDDAIEYILSFVVEMTGVDLRTYLADVFVLDALTLNEDRHFNNLGLIFDGETFRPAPIFDNGKSLLVGNQKYRDENTYRDNCRIAYAKAFSGSHAVNRRYLQKYASFHPDRSAIETFLTEHEDTISRRALQVLRGSLQDMADPKAGVPLAK